MSFLSMFLRSFNPTEPGFQFMWAILATGMFGVAIMIERSIFLGGSSTRKAEALMKEVLACIQKDDMPAALSRCTRKKHSALAQVIKAGLNAASGGAEQIRNAVDEMTLKVIPQLEKRTGFLGTIGNVATLMGLMGTIFGLIVSFAAVGSPGIDPAEKSALLAKGIAAAMNTTYLGLLIAIPSVAVYTFFKSKTQHMIDEIDEHSLRLVNVLSERSYKPQKFHIAATQLKEGVGLHVTHNNIKIFTDNKLVKEINL